MPIINSITLNRPDVCNNGRFTVSANAGGSGPLQYALIPSLTEPEPVANYIRNPQSSNVFDSLSADTYYVRVYNNCGNAVTQQMIVAAFTGTPSFSSIEFAPLGCDSVWFNFNLSTYVNLSNSIDTSISRVWVNWPDGSTDSISVHTNMLGTGSSNFTFIAHVSKIDSLYNASLNYWQNITNFPFTINFGYKDMCSNVYTSSYTVNESQNRILDLQLSETHALTSCDSIAYRFRIRYTRTGPAQTLYHIYRNIHNFEYSVDSGATWTNGKISNSLGSSASTNSYSNYFALNRNEDVMLLVAMCGDTLSAIISPPDLPLLSTSLSQSNLRSCLGNSGISISRGNASGNKIGIEMISAPIGQAIIPYFETTIPTSFAYPIELTNLMLGTYTIRIWDTIEVDCPRDAIRNVTLTHPAELDFDMDFACNGNLLVYTSNTYRNSSSNVNLSSSFRVKIYDSTGTTQLLGGVNGYFGLTTTLPGYTTASAPASAIAALPDGTYIIKAYKYVLDYDYLPEDTCSAVEKVWIKQPNNLNLAQSKFIPDCPGSLGAIVAIASGGKPPYSYALFDSANNIVSPTVAGGNLYDNLVPGSTYNLQVIDSCGTLVNRTMSIGESLKIFIANTTTMPCPNDDVNLFIDSMPGVGYQWYKNGSPIIGETGYELFLPNIQNPADSGEYAVEIEIGDCIVMLNSFMLDPDSCGVPLPVQLKDFTAQNYMNTAMLEWTTYSEINNKGFGIERSTDGKTWNNIGFVKSKANNYKSVSIIAYNFTDNDINAPYYFYRLRQTDLDGKVTFSTIRKVSFYNNSLSEINIYPNPTSGLVHIDKLTGNETINIIELTGKIMLRIEAMSGVNKN